MAIVRYSRACILAIGLAGHGMVTAADRKVAFDSEKSATATSIQLMEKLPFTLPFHLVDGYILIEGEVMGQKGRFMFDTGTPFAFFLNNHRIPLKRHIMLPKGRAASGQVVEPWVQNRLGAIGLSDQLRFIDLPAVPHADFGFIEKGITERFLGFVGHGFNRNCLFMLDYDHQLIAFLPLPAVGEPLDTRMAGRVAATLTFTGPGDGRIPEVLLQIGDEVLTGAFDTGNQGSLTLTDAARGRLEQAGHLRMLLVPHLYGAPEVHLRASLSGMTCQEQPLVDLENLSLTQGGENRIGLGYQFLKQYVSVWNYRDKTITLLKR